MSLKRVAPKFTHVLFRTDFPMFGATVVIVAEKLTLLGAGNGRLGVGPAKPETNSVAPEPGTTLLKKVWPRGFFASSRRDGRVA